MVPSSSSPVCCILMNKMLNAAVAQNERIRRRVVKQNAARNGCVATDFIRGTSYLRCPARGRLCVLKSRQRAKFSVVVAGTIMGISSRMMAVRCAVEAPRFIGSSRPQGVLPSRFVCLGSRTSQVLSIQLVCRLAVTKRWMSVVCTSCGCDDALWLPKLLACVQGTCDLLLLDKHCKIYD